MSINNSILKILNMKDKNLIFNDNFVEERIIKNKKCLIIKGYLKNDFEKCPKCGCINEYTIVKCGTKNSLIKIPKISGLNSYLEIKKQIYKCNNCNKKITSTTSIVDYRCRISNNTKHSIINESKNILTHTYIANSHNVSNMTVQRVLERIYNSEKVYKNYLPENICIDEFTALKRKMAFNICDAKTGKTIDIVLDRKIDILENYLNHYLPEVREKVKNVVMDMYEPYLKLITKMFVNAKIIIDMFHIVQLMGKSLNKTRIKAMKGDKTNYRKYKRYWRLFFKPRLELNSSVWKKYTCFKNLMTEVDVIDYLLSQNEELKNSYELYQSILYALQRKDYDLFSKIINKEYPLISENMKTTVKTLREFSPYIKNTLEQPYSNGVMERNNNTCKLIKRVAFGFRNFKNFKARILFATNVFRSSKKNDDFSFITP